MPSLNLKSTILDHQDFVRQVYGLNNDRFFATPDMLIQVQRFVMRGLKGIRQEDKKKTTLNLLIALSWFISLMNQLHINVQEAAWNRFPGRCSCCGKCPCICRKEKRKTRKRIIVKSGKAPRTIAGFQKMFSAIYPPESRTKEQAGIHLGEEAGELAEAVLAYRGNREGQDFESIANEGADFLSCLFGVCNSLGIDVAKELAHLFSRNCHACKKTPCECTFSFIVQFRS
ncbi:MAG: hypothetical protein A2672_01555 [Candidatus Wildermuthbacteria bacterium RIFCSPHIGHO2_01_FULL_49_22b]|uniref:NTP pyrophosphohydrolase MazG putative catalytic core domain-containing protein n=1 Tax=Candidatus Wildermuthbacteria bacterium RIFCSPHIGHO2_01_FULL_49_22b TaxID=1802448 RepID=A0A1G2QWH5_9BACT|nr:MAG: hypothetical protein A2672_01555 [Candidatus Wildermuthbacteria bacterium RIFCSPHIGHO2_01_FULL_49_22b]